MTKHSAAAREMARQLLAREIAGVDDTAAVGAALQRVCTRIAENLGRSIGDDGCSALFSRVLEPTAAEHPVLLDLRVNDNAGPPLTGVAKTVETHGVPAVSEAVEALLAAVVDVLSGLIGADMVLNILDQDAPPRSPGDQRNKRR